MNQLVLLRCSTSQSKMVSHIADLYLQFVRSRHEKYSVVCIVFDGYTDELSNKAEEQSRRSNVMSADIKFNVKTDVTTTREMFLRNARN